MEDNKKILYIPQRGIGDLIHSLPLIHSLRDAYHGSSIAVPIVDRSQKESSKSFGDLFEGIVRFDYFPLSEDIEERRKILYRSKDFAGKYQKEAGLRREFEKELYEFYLDGQEYDLVIVPRKLSIDNIETENQLTLRDLRQFKGLHIVDRNLLFADVLGIQKSHDFSLNFGRSSAVDSFGKEINLPQDYSIIILGSGRSSKQWTLEGFRELVNYLLSIGQTPLLIGSPNEFPISRNLESPRVLNLTSENDYLIDLENSAIVFSGARAVIGPDTGLTHIADAVGTPVIGLYGPTRPSKFAPYHNKERVVSTNSSTKKMEDIEPKEVIGKLEEILEI